VLGREIPLRLLRAIAPDPDHLDPLLRELKRLEFLDEKMDAADIAEQCGLRFEIGAAHRFLGEIAVRSNPAQVTEPLAAPHFLQSISVLQEIGAENELARAYAGYGRLLARQGHRDEARRHLVRALDIFERLGTLIEPEGVREALAELGPP
jgi:tetratricopeptide (TPR) repeat protein